MKRRKETEMKQPEVMFGQNEIRITAAFAKKAKTVDSPEYKELMELLENHPGYQVVVPSPVKRKRAGTMKGLTYECMEKFICSQDGEDSAAMAEFKDLTRIVSYGNGETARRSYGEVKKWFLTKYPCLAEFRAETDRILGKVS